MTSSNAPSPPERQVGHEITDASAGFSALAGLGLLLVMFAAIGIGAVLYVHDEQATAASDPLRNPQTGSQVPPEPRLQAQPRVALETLRRADDERLNHYRWLDRDAGRLQIPIDRAIDLLSERGFPMPRPTASSRETPP